MGYVAGGLLVGVIADVTDFTAAISLVAGLTALSGALVAIDLPADLPQRSPLAAEGPTIQGS
jgi:hypothetical protein